MSAEFELMDKVVIGQYIPMESFIHRLDPRAKIIGVGMLILAVTFAPGIWGLMLATVSALICLVAAHIPLRYALRAVLSPLPFLMIIALIQVFFSQVGDSGILIMHLGPLHLTSGGLIQGLVLLIRFVGLILWISLSSFTTSFTELVYGLRSLLAPLARLGLPVDDLVMMIQVTLRFIPYLTLTLERIIKAQASRGAVWGSGKANLMERIRQVQPVLIPLFVISLRRADRLALAMEARGYPPQGKRGSWLEMKAGVKDIAAVLMCLAASIGMFILH